MSNDEEKDVTNLELLEAMNRSFSRIEEKMATKEALEEIKVDLTQVKVDLQSFKVETRERFDSIDEKLKDMDENVTGIVGDYHPHIVALEEKVFGHSTLAEA